MAKVNALSDYFVYSYESFNITKKSGLDVVKLVKYRHVIAKKFVSMKVEYNKWENRRARKHQSI